MSEFNHELKTIKLRKSNIPIKDYSSPKLAGFITHSEINEYQDKVLDCNIETWYCLIKEYTFPTVFCSLSLDEAQLFIQVYEKNFKDLLNIEDIDWRNSLNENESEIIKKLEQRIQNEINNFIEPNGSIFAKTSSRSAKDSPVYTKKFQQLYKQFLSDKISNENEQITCLLKAAFQSLRIQNGTELIEMFIKSERIYQDMLLAVEKRARFNENIVLRKFIDIDVDMEFRGFVYNKKLTALSQYNYLIYSKQLNENKIKILQAIQTFYEKNVALKLDEAKFLTCFVIDFAIVSGINYFIFDIFFMQYKIYI